MTETPPPAFPDLSSAWVHLTDAVIVRGEGCHLFDRDGRRYLDFTSGIGVTGTGHCHPAVVAAIREQAGKLLFGQINCVIPQATLEAAAVLREIVPRGLDTFFFSNSGAEATEAAVKLARAATGRPNVIAFEGSFHGRTALAMALTSSKTLYRQGYQPLPAGVHFAPFPYPYHYGWDEEATVAFCLRQLDHLLHAQCPPKDAAAILVEPVLGEGGYVPAPAAFLRGLRERCDRHGILLLVDEIQCGFGRTGTMWAHEPSGIAPDVMLMAKCIASGMPMSAIAAPRPLMEKWQPGSHGGTYGGGNAVVMAAARATVAVLREEGLAENARRMGEALAGGLRALARRHASIGEVRGPGLMQAVELRRDLSDPKKTTERVTKACAARGLLLLSCGTYGNVVRWIPPLVVRREQIDEALAIFDGVLSDLGL